MNEIPEEPDFEFLAEGIDCISIFLAREEFRREKIKDDQIYRINFKNGAVELRISMSGKSIKKDAEPLYALIKERLEQEWLKELTPLDSKLLEYDSAICTRYMNYQMRDYLYREAIHCANRIIKNCELIEEYYGRKIESNSTMKTQAETVRNFAHILWENPATANIRIAIDKAKREKNDIRTKELEKQLEEYQLPQKGY